ncbi:recombination protein F [Burkholderia pseudomallei]|nr:recombination protein F [Burkholderia pseudomallei]
MDTVAGEAHAESMITEAPCRIKKIVLSNFKKFDKLTLAFQPDLNVLVGDNEAGKSTILLAMDLALSGSRSKVESLGIEALLRKQAVDQFLTGKKSAADLPVLAVEIFLSELTDWEAHGRCNSLHEDTFGLRFTCEPSDDYGNEIAQVLRQPEGNFPFEFYSIKFVTFGGQPYNGHRRYLEHLLLDSALINTDYAHREYTRKLYQTHATASERASHENSYRQAKRSFWTEHLTGLNDKLDVKFWVRSSPRSNLESDLVLVKDDMPIESKGRGQQSLIKTQFALQRGTGKRGLDVLLLEEPENHLSHVNMRALVDGIAKSAGKQLFVSTHSSLICSRLDLRKAILLDQRGNHATLDQLDEPTAAFFCKAPDHNVLEFVMSRNVILVEGDAEFILMSELYRTCTASTLEKDGVHVIAVGGTSFKRYLALAKILKIRTAVVRDNDGDYQKNCVSNYEDFAEDHIKVFADPRADRSTFEICLYQDNTTLCDGLFKDKRRTLSVQDYMLANKAEAALALLTAKGSELKVPDYLCEAIAWIKQ